MGAGTLPLNRAKQSDISLGQLVSPATTNIEISAVQPASLQPDTPEGMYLSLAAGASSQFGTAFAPAAASTDTVSSADYAFTVARIADLLTEDLKEDQPSEYAYNGTLKLISDAGRELGLRFPLASAAVGPNRGLRITWSSGAREVRLVHGGGPENRSYIYSESGSDHGVDYDINGSRLAQHLLWAMNEL